MNTAVRNSAEAVCVGCQRFGWIVDKWEVTPFSSYFPVGGDPTGTRRGSINPWHAMCHMPLSMPDR
jgi:hypothetical protein